ncbi:hypothetical protein JR316_0003515 [Psilocybe cubensis]|nr:hypothetical protein JR316_0003515 [Psilocybe cubensis]KAH9484036.1 hypothetical protein JR316_0003515 [Psilocybe cubensis]
MPPATSFKADNDIIRHPSPFILNVIGGRPIVRHKGAAKSQTYRDPNEIAEDGTVQMEMKSFTNSPSFSSSSSTSTTKPPKGIRPTSGRVKLGSRPKLD